MTTATTSPVQVFAGMMLLGAAIFALATGLFLILATTLHV